MRFRTARWLEQAKLPASCTTLGKYVFDGCQALTALDVAEGNTAYLSQDACCLPKTARPGAVSPGKGGDGIYRSGGLQDTGGLELYWLYRHSEQIEH